MGLLLVGLRQRGCMRVGVGGGGWLTERVGGGRYMKYTLTERGVRVAAMVVIQIYIIVI